jgi:predicted dehydrogenase
VTKQTGGREATEAVTDDTFLFTLHFLGGGFAQMIGTLAAPFGPGASMEMYGSSGTLMTPSQQVSWRALSPRGRNPPAGGRVLAGRVGDARLMELPIPSGEAELAGERDVHLLPFRRLVREFVRGVEEGLSPSPSFYDGMRCQEILDAVRLSASTGQRVSIPQPK